MLSLLTVAALGFSLEGHDLGHGRQLADNHEPCKAGCDAGHDASCDEQDLAGRWTRSCDMHPTTSCDEDCECVKEDKASAAVVVAVIIILVLIPIGCCVAICLACCAMFKANQPTGDRRPVGQQLSAFA